MESETKRPTRFRVLIIGKANAGKTTILRALCGTNDEPEVYDRKGHRIGSVRATFHSIRNKIAGRDSSAILAPSSTRGLHKIDYSFIFPSNRGYIFHDSRGFESGATDELELVRDFIQTRATSNDLDEQLHAIWYCFPTDGNRLITAAEQEFFGKIDTGRVPVIAVFTKFDALDSAAFQILETCDLSFEEAKQGAPAYAEELFKTAHLPLVQNQPHPPKSVVFLRNMQNNNSHKGVSDLIEKTFTSLDDDALKLLLVYVQHSNVKLCIKAAVESGVITDAAMALAKQGEVSSFKPDARFVWGILKWFPYIWLTALNGIKNALIPSPSLACSNHPPLEALLIGLAVITVAADSFWIQHGDVNASGIEQAFQNYVTSGASEHTKAAVLRAFSKPLGSYSTYACNTKLLQIIMDNHIDPPAAGQPSGSGSA
ncbi:hypothetical protein BOTBODRAFT_37992 [Botryobasidium botryosum FD-172 SS1]|uniref:Uncharacterized protein n=1 Tax=Botryobasidium botryosum (strain FD-172 SS1) TaxID=930990 RepID=A0A067LYI8_BOTB1|nr:hypothetical protein BOTBODRAFT_37992 [Botryobasidium botryosum FD-172 SS1]